MHTQMAMSHLLSSRLKIALKIGRDPKDYTVYALFLLICFLIATSFLHYKACSNFCNLPLYIILYNVFEDILLSLYLYIEFFMKVLEIL